MYDSAPPSAGAELALPTHDILDTPQIQSATDTRQVTPVASYVERWEQGLRVVLDIPPDERDERLNMAVWGYQTACGTVACFAGHCSLDDWFRKQGYTSDFEENPDSGVPELYFTGVLPKRFFGSVGHYDILMAKDLSYDELIDAVREHIAYLKEGGDPNVSPPLGRNDSDRLPFGLPP